MIIVVLAAVICFESWAICRLTEKVSRLKKKVTDMKGEVVALTNKLKDERALTTKLLQEEVFSEQRPYKNWFYPVIGESNDDEIA